MVERQSKQRAVQIIARTIYKDLQAQGFDEQQIVALASELISNVSSSLAANRDSTAAAHAPAA